MRSFARWDVHLPAKALLKLTAPGGIFRCSTQSHNLRAYFCVRMRGRRLHRCRWMTIRLHEEHEDSKVTYWGLIFFCIWLVVFGVGRSLGYPSGGLWHLWGNVLDGWRHKG